MRDAEYVVKLCHASRNTDFGTIIFSDPHINVRKRPAKFMLLRYNKVMKLDHNQCYSIIKSKDERFDGRFFTAVLTTGIYCRPICPATLPRPENVQFFATAAAATEAGFRPCLRCRPESSPGTPDWQGPSSLVSRGLRLISEGVLDECGVDEVARQLNIGTRQLRRLFVEHLGAPPIAVAQTRRLHFAKKLIRIGILITCAFSVVIFAVA